MKYGVCYYVLGSQELCLEFIEDDSLESVIFRVKTNDFTGVRFARTGLDEVPYINICDDKGYCLCRIPVSELQYNSYGYILDNYGDDDSDDVNSAEQGESVDVENTSVSEQDNTADKRTCETCKYRNIYFRCDCHSSHLFNRDLKYDYSCIFYVNKNHYVDVFRSGG